MRVVLLVVFSGTLIGMASNAAAWVRRTCVGPGFVYPVVVTPGWGADPKGWPGWNGDPKEWPCAWRGGCGNGWRPGPAPFGGQPPPPPMCRGGRSFYGPAHPVGNPWLNGPARRGGCGAWAYWGRR